MGARWLALVAFVLSVGCALAGELAPQLRTAIDGFSAHRRVALGYLRTDNPELAAIEIEQMRDRWQEDMRNLPPDAMNDRALAAALVATGQAILDALAEANRGELGASQRLLDHAAQPLQAWRSANGIRLFSDCIVEVGSAYGRLDVHRVKAPDLTILATRDSILAATTDTETALKHCDTEAQPGIRNEAEFRRLIDGMLNSLSQMPEALRLRDNGLLHRLLIEQRSFERLLAFRFG